MANLQLLGPHLINQKCVHLLIRPEGHHQVIHEQHRWILYAALSLGIPATSFINSPHLKSGSSGALTHQKLLEWAGQN